MSALVVLVHALVHDDAAPVGTAKGIAREGVHGELEALLTGMVVGEAYVLRCQQGLGGNIVGVHALPSSWNGASVEDYLQSVAVGVDEDVLIEFHHLLLVAAKEVHLYSGNVVELHPCHLLIACIRCVHPSARSLWGIVPEAVGVVP